MNTDNADIDIAPAMAPLEIAGHRLRNRIVASPMSTNMANRDGSITDDLIDFYAGMGRGGCGMVTIGGTSVSGAGSCSANGTHIGAASLEPGLRRLAEEVKRTGAVCSIQLFHVGAQGNSRYTGTPVYGPSPYVCPDIQIEAQELTADQISVIEDEFVTGIISALACGFDLVELHLAHGYLLHEFLSPFFNRRKDRYGGCEANRLRILANILEKLAQREPGAAKFLGARISGDDFQVDGLTIERNRSVVALLESHGAAYWSVSAGVYETAPFKYDAMREGRYWAYAEDLRAMAGAPVIAQGGVNSVRLAADIIRKGQADMVGIARALIADPNLVRKTLDGNEQAIAPCIDCDRCKYLKRTDLTFDCLVEEGYHPRDMAALRTRVDPSGISVLDETLRLSRRRRIHPEGHI